jgi:hypothetical protein
MSQDKKPYEPEFFIEETRPDPALKQLENELKRPDAPSTPPALAPAPVVDEGPSIDIHIVEMKPRDGGGAGIDLPRQQGLVVAQDVPAADDPGALLRQLTSSMPAGRLRPEEMAREAETTRHNAHVEALRMINLDQRRARREAQGKPRKKR